MGERSRLTDGRESVEDNQTEWKSSSGWVTAKTNPKPTEGTVSFWDISTERYQKVPPLRRYSAVGQTHDLKYWFATPESAFGYREKNPIHLPQEGRGNPIPLPPKGSGNPIPLPPVWRGNPIPLPSEGHCNPIREGVAIPPVGRAWQSHASASGRAWQSRPSAAGRAWQSHPSAAGRT